MLNHILVIHHLSRDIDAIHVERHERGIGIVHDGQHHGVTILRRIIIDAHSVAVDGDAIGHALPRGGVCTIAGGALGNGHLRGGCLQSGSRPAGKDVMLAGGVQEGEGLGLDIVGSGIPGLHAAAVQLIGDREFGRQPAGIQHQVVAGHGCCN